MTSKRAECDLWVLRENLEENPEEFLSVTLLSPVLQYYIIIIIFSSSHYDSTSAPGHQDVEFSLPHLLLCLHCILWKDLSWAMAWSLNLRATRLSSLMRDWITFQRLALLSMLPLENDLKERRRIGVGYWGVWVRSYSTVYVMVQSRLWCSIGFVSRGYLKSRLWYSLGCGLARLRQG